MASKDFEATEPSSDNRQKWRDHEASDWTHELTPNELAAPWVERFCATLKSSLKKWLGYE